MTHRTNSPLSRKHSLFSTMRTGLNHFESLQFRSATEKKRSVRLKTTPGREVEGMLKTRRDQCRQIHQEFKNEREMQLLDFVKKSLKYQELLDINDHKKKRLPTLNSKVGEVVKVSLSTGIIKTVSYSLQTQVFSLQSSSPPVREGHTTLIYHHNAIVIGGHCSSPYSSGHCYSFSLNAWTKHFQLPSARSYHSTVLYKDRYGIVFGGMGPYDVSRKCRVCYNTVNLIDLYTLSTRTLKMVGDEMVEGRRAHACVLMGKYMLVFGGINTKRDHLKDFIYLDLKQLRWYRKQYQIESRELAQDLEKGIARHKAIAHFKQNHKTLPLYSSDYSDIEGLYFFGGSFGHGVDSIVLFMSLNAYSPCLKRVSYSGSPPSATNTVAEKIEDNLVVIISGEITDRGVKLFKIKQRQFVGIYKYINNPYFGGIGSTLNRCEQGLVLLFGLSEGGYSSQVVTFKVQQQQTQQMGPIARDRKVSNNEWKIWDQKSVCESGQLM